jgi:PII-like signaling protein
MTMQGYQLSFITELDRRIEGKQPMDWLMQQATRLGISGVTMFSGTEGIGSHGRRHSAGFFELTDQPIEIIMAVTTEQSSALFDKINSTDTRLFYIKTPIEYGELGQKAIGPATPG